MSFDDVFTATDEAAIMDALGNAMLYGTTPIIAVIDYGLQDVFIQDAHATAPAITITALKTDVPGVKHGSRFTHAGRSIVVDAVVNDNGVHYTLACRYG